MQTQEFKEIFGGFDPAEYSAEAQARWGESDAYAQSQERTARYGKADWQTIRTEMDALSARYLAAKSAGHPPASAEAQAIAADHCAHLERWFYDAPPQLLRGLAQMWVADERFRANIDRADEGLAAYQSAAMLAWANMGAHE
ncbi:hypothetical protein GCM10017783_20340 [Deinococcus piscis]|uniref:TipAS antibiotic-recognition domain-containing protein n=2 Tax=Deinococcus piscis TaxID=394230 RepID=A0ABQ3KEY8_9DEIO|nr:TipAS antibiotic-recognition domain-containing protein [Deinococcus piscis]GHG07695.1 hypothetical protein GCM10017783_20340 [Deinococcus piscis]